MDNKREFKGIWIPKEIWLSELTLSEKVFLAEIDSLSSNKKDCFASNAYFAKFFQMSKARCSQVIGSLEKKGLIEITLKMKDRQVVERRIKLSDGVVNILTRGSKYSKGGSKFLRSIDTNIEQKEVEDKSSTIIVRKNEIDLEPYKKIAWKLSKIIQTKKNISHTPNQVKSWSEEIRKLHTVNKVDITRQKQVLKWYKTAIGGEFIPVVESGKAFRDKFIKLESAMNREQKIVPKLDNAYNSGTYEIKKKAIKL